MKNTQEYINQNYPDKEIKVLDLESKDLEGNLDLSEFTKLEELNCSRNCLDNLNISHCSSLVKLDCSYNTLDDLDFLTKLPTPEKLVHLNLEECGASFSSEEIAKILAPF